MFSALKIFTAVVVLLNAPVSWAQEASFTSMPGDVLEDLIALPTVENTWWLLGGTVATFLAYEVEDPEGAVRGLDRGLLDSLADFGNIWGDMRVQVPLALGCWVGGSWQASEEIADLGYDLSRGLLLTYSITGVSKHVVRRDRPNGGSLSFPSGHTAAAFTTAGVLSRHYGGLVGAAGIGLGVLTGLGRMEDNKHFASDVVAGAAIGWIIGRTVAREGSSEPSAWRVVPSSNGLVLVGAF